MVRNRTSDCCIRYKSVNKECPEVAPQFNYHISSDNLPEHNYVNSEDIAPLPINWSAIFSNPFNTDYTTSAPPVRTIPYMIATEYQQGHYNTTFTWESIERVLRSIERFKAVKYVRVMRGARLTFLQTNRDLGRGVAAVATKSKGLIRINPTFNFARNLAYCDRVCYHENFHLTGSSNHTSPGDPRPLMHMYGGNLDTLLPIDETYISVYPWNGSARFSTTPNLLSSLSSTTEVAKVMCGIETSWRDRLVYP